MAQAKVNNDGSSNNENKDEAKVVNNGSNVPDFSGKWETYKSENFEQFLIDAGASWAQRKMAKVFMGKTMYQTIKQTGNEFEINTEVMGKKQTLKFKVDGFKTEYEFKNARGNTIKRKYAWNDDKTKLMIKNNDVTQKQETTSERYFAKDDQNGKIIIIATKNKKGTEMKQYWKQSK